jgi:predicted RecA/RadA family phage recombinase
MSNEYRKDSNIISWTNNLTAGSGTVAKGSLVHIGNGMFGVAVDAIAFGATGELIVRGYFTGGSAIINETLTVGKALFNSTTDIMVVTTLASKSVTESGSATVLIDMSNLRLASDNTASASAQAFTYYLG